MPKRPTGNPLKPHIDAIREANPEMTPTRWVQELYPVAGIDAIFISKMVGGRWLRKGAFRRGQGFFTDSGLVTPADKLPDPVETFLSSTWGDGSYDLQPGARGLIVAHFIVDIALGLASAPMVPDAGNVTHDSVLDDIDGELARVMKRQSAMATIRQLQEFNRASDLATKGGEDDVKAEDIVTIVKAIQPPAPVADPRADRVYDVLMTMLQSERDRNQGLLNAAPSPWVSMLAPVVDLIKTKFTPAMIERIFARPIAEGTVLAPVSGGLWGGIGEVLAPLVRELGPALALLISQRVAATATATVAAPAAPVAPATQAALPAVTSPPSSPTADEIAHAEHAENAESWEQIVLWIETEQYGEAWEAVKLLPDDDVRLWLSQIRPGIRPEAYWLHLRRFHPRLGGELREKALAFVAYAQKDIAEALAAMQGGAEEEPEA